MVKKSIFILCFFILSLYGQSYNDLKKIQNEINQLKKELSTSKNKLQSTLKLIEQYEKQIRLLNTDIRKIDAEIKKNQVLLDSLTSEASTTASRIEELRKHLMNQTQLIYISGIYKDKVDFFSFFDRNNYQKQKKYLQYLLNYEIDLVQSFERLQSKQQELTARQKEAIAKLKKSKKALSQRKTDLLASEKSRKDLVAKLKSNQKYLTSTLEQKQKSYESLRRLLKSLESSNKKKNAPIRQNKEWIALKGKFPRLKGKLNWPVNGSILHKFGKIRQNKIKLPNKGIDIKAKKGTPVRAVHDGVAVKVTYMPFIGNTIIIDHNDDYFSVYCHLDDFFVSEGDFVKSGQEIGAVGESQSLEGPKLHFEIWAKNKPLNPQQWLR
ncbi:MAG: peptidoglycan DD-metalloendopeptidase family protein [Calditrichia bacterium]